MHLYIDTTYWFLYLFTEVGVNLKNYIVGWVPAGPVCHGLPVCHHRLLHQGEAGHPHAALLRHVQGVHLCGDEQQR